MLLLVVCDIVYLNRASFGRGEESISKVRLDFFFAPSRINHAYYTGRPSEQFCELAGFFCSTNEKLNGSRFP